MGNLLEASRYIHEQRENREKSWQNVVDEVTRQKEEFHKNYHSIIETRQMKERQHGKLLEEARNFNFAKALKAIYITALESYSLTDDAIMLAETMVDNYIKENGGATKIFNNCDANTYLLSRLRSIVEDAAEEDVKDAEDSEKDDGTDKPESKEEEKEETAENEEEKDSDNEDKKEEDESSEENKESDDSESATDSLANPEFEDIDDTEIPDDATTPEDDNETDVADDIADDLAQTPEEDITVDGDTENNGKIFDELEKEEDVKKAIELIRQRVADAEETFIKRNAEDKKAIDELINRVSDNVKAVEDLNDKAEIDDKAKAQAEIAEESVRINKQKINAITENRPLTIMEKMIRNLSRNITKDEVIREQYMTESGKIDTAAIVEAGKVMYGFLETINTLQLEKVDTKYIQKILEEMN